MSDDVGVVSVATLEQIARVHRLRRAAEQLRVIATALVVEAPPIPSWLLAAALLPPEIGDARLELDSIVAQLQSIADRAESLAQASETGALAYGEAEQRNKDALARLGGVAGVFAGAAIHWAMVQAVTGAGVGAAATLAMVAPGNIPVVMAAAAGAAPALSPAPVLSGVKQLVLDNPAIISNPATANVVRAITAGTDEGLAAVGLGGPGTLSLAFGQVGFARRGMEGTAAQVLQALRVGGAYRESDVETHRVIPPHTAPARSVPPPSTLAERVERIPRIEQDGGAQVRIERYDRPNQRPSYTVYIAGTAQWGAKGSTTPFDFTSDLSQKAGERSGAYRAVEQAMREEGITSSDRVAFVGHSLGGLIAHDLAASKDWNTAGVLEVGSPPSDRRALDSAPDIVIENDSDIVPALGQRAEDDAVIVRTHPFDTDDVPPTSPGDPVPAHSRDVYTRMASAADASEVPRLRDAIAAMNALGAGATVTTTDWKSVRIDAPISGGRAPAHG